MNKNHYSSLCEGTRGAVVTSVNMHKLGESFVEKVSDVRSRATVDGKVAAPGESLEFLAHGGPQAETGSTVTTGFHRTEGGIGKGGRRGHLLHPTDTPALVDDEGWWYGVRSVIWI